MPPTAAEIVIGTVTVALACLGGACAMRAVARGQRLWLVGAAGCLLLVAGVVGQRSFPSSDAVGRLGKDEAARQLPGAWEAGVGIPVVGFHITPVALVGLLLSIAGTSLVLFFEAPASASGPAGRALPPLEEDDSV